MAINDAPALTERPGRKDDRPAHNQINANNCGNSQTSEYPVEAIVVDDSKFLCVLLGGIFQLEGHFGWFVE